MTVGLGRFGGHITEDGVRVSVPRLNGSTVTRLMLGVNWYH